MRRRRGRATACEVLLDNAVWGEMQSEMAAVDWPSGEDFYSVACFSCHSGRKWRDQITLRCGGGAIGGEIVAPRAEFSEDDVYAAMAAAGIPAAVADRAYKFTQTAWGGRSSAHWGSAFTRLPLPQRGGRRGGVRPVGRGAVFRCGPCDGRAALTSPGFRRATMSADVHAVNSLPPRRLKAREPGDKSGGPVYGTRRPR